MKQQLQYQAERLKMQIEELQQILRRVRLGIVQTLQDLEDIEGEPTPEINREHQPVSSKSSL